MKLNLIFNNVLYTVSEGKYSPKKRFLFKKMFYSRKEKIMNFQL